MTHGPGLSGESYEIFVSCNTEWASKEAISRAAMGFGEGWGDCAGEVGGGDGGQILSWTPNHAVINVNTVIGIPKSPATTFQWAMRR